MAAQVAREGKISPAELNRLFRDVSDRKLTGCVEITSNAEWRKFYVMGGHFHYFQSGYPRENPERFLKTTKDLDPDLQTRLLETARQRGSDALDYALSEGYLQEKAVIGWRVRTLFEMIDSIFHQDWGTFRLLIMDDVPMVRGIARVSWTGLEKRMEQRERTWRVLEKQLPPSLSKLTITGPGLNPEAEEALSASQKRILQLIPKEGIEFRKLRETSPWHGYDTCKLIGQLISRDLISFSVTESGAAMVSPGTSDAAAGRDNDAGGFDLPAEMEGRNEIIYELKRAVSFERQGYILDAFRVMAKLHGQHAQIPEIQARYQSLQSKLDTELDAIIQDCDLIPRHTNGMKGKDITKVGLNAREGYLLSLVDGKLSLKMLSRLTGISCEDSRRIAYRLLKEDLIQFKQAKKESTKDKSGEEKKESPPELDYSLENIRSIYDRYCNQDHYTILNVGRKTPLKKIHESFARLSKLYHPDMSTNIEDEEVTETLEELFQMIYTAYRTLTNPREREIYDQMLRESEAILSKELEATTNVRPAANKEADDPEQSEKSSRESEVGAAARYARPSLRPVAPPVKKLSRKERGEKSHQEAEALFERRKYQEAEENILFALRCDNRNKEYYFLLSRIQLAWGRKLDEAELNAKRAITLDQENPDYYLQLARVCEAKQDDSNAERYAKMAFAWDPDHPEARKFVLDRQNQKKGSVLSRILKGRKGR